MTKQYKHAVLGGTFDHFHEGHKAVLGKAIEIADHITIGLATDQFSKRKFLPQIIQPYECRLAGLTEYLTGKKFISLTKIIQLDDIFGPTLTDASMDAIIVTADTYQNAEIINELRKEHGLSPLAIIEIPFIKGESSDIIHSTRIRRGDLDREGFSYEKLFQSLLIMPANLKASLRHPLGDLVKGKDESETAKLVIKKIQIEKPFITIAVGDITFKTLLKAGMMPDIGIIDGKTKRKKIDSPILYSKSLVLNEPGTINPLSVMKISESIERKLATQQNEIICISGEEDLLALPAILLSPLSSIVMYGLAGAGIVMVESSEQSKDRIRKIVEKFKQGT